MLAPRGSRARCAWYHSDMTAQTYDRLFDEAEDAWTAFYRYRDRANPRPSLDAYAAETGHPASRVKTWAARYDWAARLVAWDQVVDGARQGATLRGVEEMASRHIRLAKLATDAAEKALIRIHKDLDTGEFTRLKPHEIARLVEVGSKLERLSRGEATERVDADAPDYSKLPDADLAALEEIAAKLH